MAAEDWFDDWGEDEWDDQWGQQYLEETLGSYEDENKQRRRSDDMTRWRKPDKWVDFEDVRFKRRTEKAWICVFEDGTERAVPISQTPDGFDPEEGSTGTLTITEWLAQKWDEEGPPEKEEPVEVANVTCLRETERAIQVRVGDLDPIWLPRGQVLEDSDVLHDGDMGTLRITAWIAKEKGLGPDAPVSYERVAQDVGRQRERARAGTPSTGRHYERGRAVPASQAVPKDPRQTSWSEEDSQQHAGDDDDLPF